MKKRYRDAFKKALKAAFLAQLPHFIPVKKLNFASEFFRGEMVYVAQTSPILQQIISISIAPRKDMTFHVFVSWAEAGCGDYPAQESEAFIEGESGALDPRPEVKFGVVSLQMLEGLNLKTGYAIPAPFDRIDAKSEAYLGEHGSKAVLTQEYERHLVNWLAEANMEDELRTDEMVMAACQNAADRTVTLLQSLGLPFLERVVVTRSGGALS